MERKHPIKILVVECEPNKTGSAFQALSRWAEENKAKMEQASTVKEALEKLSTDDFDLVLTDYQLSDQTSVDFLAQIKAKNYYIPILLMTHAGDELLALNVLKSGFSDYLVKSENSFRELPHMIETACERHQMVVREKKLETELANKNTQLETLGRKLSERSVRDELTGLYNHRFFQEKMAEEFARATRYHYPLSCLMVDIDQFKTINDTHGHVSGDEILKNLASFFTSYLRQTDTVARYGGEEFVVSLPHIGYEGANLLAERLRKKILDQSFSLGSGTPVQISVSIGIASYPEDPIDRKETMLFYADKALYRAKSNGRNQVVLYKNIIKDYVNQIPDLKFSDEKVYQFRQRLFDISEMSKRAYIEATKALINALEAKDPHTMGHAARVGHYSALTAREMGLGEDDVRIIEHAGLLHDIGKICVSDEILLKPGAYTHQEYEKMKAHPVMGYQIVKPIKFLADEALIILHHHEWFNGEGYPHRLKGREIPFGARIVSVLDAYDTMRVAGGRYKRTLNCEEAVRELIQHAGTQFDPLVVLHFVHLLLKGGDIKPDAYDQRKLEQTVRAFAA
ncbi:MAG: diguanylate cyclase [Candidatus Omnitrophica bacterium]|nr:diguanylate cyclase [Candidatus Omnitrophota bacterium]